MNQVSPPLRILLVAVFLLGAVYMVALRPKAEEVPATPATPAAAPAAPAAAAGGEAAVSAPGQAAEAARQAAATEAADAQRAAGQDPSTAPAPATPATPAGSPATAPAKPAATAVTVAGAAAAVADNAIADTPQEAAERDVTLPARLRVALAERKVIVLLLYGARGSDDREVRREVAGISRRGGRVVVATAPISRLARYSRITRGADVLQAPTIVIVNRYRRALALPGYYDRGTIDQRVRDALIARPPA